MSERPEIRTTLTGDLIRQQELIRQREIRHSELVPIYVMWTPDVPFDAGQAALQGVRDTLIASGQNREIVNMGSSTWSQGDYSSAAWYVNEAFKNQELRRNVGYGPQLDVHQFGRLFTQEPWQKNPHWEVLIVNNDLNGRLNGEFINFIYGNTMPEFPASVQSVRRILETPGPNQPLKLAMIRNLLRHESGHMFGLVGRTRGDNGLIDNHCPNPCSMKQTMDIISLAQNTIEVENKREHFCTDCRNEFVVKQNRFKPLINR